jgi:cytochrome P450
VILFEDPPLHTMHRKLLSRVFTPRRMAELEDQVRRFCVRGLDPLVGSPGFDIVAELAAMMPMRVIGMLLGIPEQDQVAVRNRTDANLRTEPGRPMDVKEDEVANGDMFAEYIEWRAEHPSDDLMTQLLNAEFEDETGRTRTLTRQEVLTYTAVIAGAGNETTGRLIGWLAKVLAEHPDQRRAVAEDRSLIPNVIDETLRFEPTGHAVARYVTEDVEYYGRTLPADSPILLIVASANRDPRRFDRPDTFDIFRSDLQHLTFGQGLHHCLGANLARLQGQVALDEILNRWPTWDVDYDRIKLAPTSTVRGWEAMPIIVG